MPRKDGFKSVKIISIDPGTNPAFNYKPRIKKSLLDVEQEFKLIVLHSLTKAYHLYPDQYGPRNTQAKLPQD